MGTQNQQMFFPLNILGLILFCLTLCSANGIDNKVLIAGNGLFKETLPLRMGSRYYQLLGLKPYTWYEVKISYPASIPAVFTLQLKKGNSDVGMNRLRKLLNTEKLIFKTEDLDEGGMYVLVTVEPEGVVALPGVQERETILFNIGQKQLVNPRMIDGLQAAALCKQNQTSEFRPLSFNEYQTKSPLVPDSFAIFIHNLFIQNRFLILPRCAFLCCDSYVVDQHPLFHNHLTTPCSFGFIIHLWVQFMAVCDELILGLPYKAWPVIAFAVLCVLLGLTVPRFLPPLLLPREENLSSAAPMVGDKDS